MATAIILVAVIISVLILVVIRFSTKSKKSPNPRSEVKRDAVHSVASTTRSTGVTEGKPLHTHPKTVDKPVVEQPPHNPDRRKHQDISRPGSNKQADVNVHSANFQEASTVLDVTRVVEGKDDTEAENLLIAYKSLVDNIRSGDIGKFCQKHTIISLRRSENSRPKEIILELADDISCSEADIWAVLHSSGEKYYILPGGETRLRYGALNVKNSGQFKEIFGGIIGSSVGNRFQLLQLGIAKRRGGELIVTSEGKVGIPFV